MKNPFNEKEDKYKYDFFKEMTEAINEWMLEQYPEFDSKLVSKIKEVQRFQDQLKVDIENQNKALEAIKERHFNYLSGAVNEFMKKNYPDVSNSIVLKFKELEKIIETHKQNVDKTKSKLEKVIQSDSIYEDVYKLRDEFKEIQKFMDGFKKKVKKAFEI